MGSREVEPRRKRKRTPSDERRKAERAQGQLEDAARHIEAKARERQRAWATSGGRIVYRNTIDLNGRVSARETSEPLACDVRGDDAYLERDGLWGELRKTITQAERGA